MRIAFFGSGSFAVPALETLVRTSGRDSLVAVVTKPDRPARRGRKLFPTPVRSRARELGIECEAPETLRDPQVLEHLRALAIDLAIVADYGEILRRSFLDLPRIGAFNLHASILPRWRGAAPVQHAILAGDEETGVTLFRIEEGLDSGPIVAIRKTAIDPYEKASELEARLARLAAELLEETLPSFADGTFEETPQDTAGVTRAPKLTKDFGRIDWSLPPRRLVDFVRALDPWPRATTWLERRAGGRERVILHAVREAETDARPDPSVEPGTITAVTKRRLEVACGGGAIDIVEIQPEGKAVMSAAAFLNGHAVVPGDRFVDLDEEEGRRTSAAPER